MIDDLLSKSPSANEQQGMLVAHGMPIKSISPIGHLFRSLHRRELVSSIKPPICVKTTAETPYERESSRINNTCRRRSIHILQTMQLEYDRDYFVLQVPIRPPPQKMLNGSGNHVFPNGDRGLARDKVNFGMQQKVTSYTITS